MLQFMKTAKETSTAKPVRYVAVQQRGLISLPADIRRRHDLDRPGAQVGIVERADGIIELHRACLSRPTRPGSGRPGGRQWSGRSMRTSRPAK